MLPWRRYSPKPVVLFPKPSSSQTHQHFHRTETINPSHSLSKVKHLVKNGLFDDALHLYHLLRASNPDPTTLPVVYALKACAGLPAFHDALSIHAFVTKSGLLDRNLAVGNSLIEMYSRFSRTDAARYLFDEMPQRNTVSWNLMMSGYSTSGKLITALNFCSSMKNNGVAMDEVGFKIVLPICGRAKALTIGESVHGHLLVSGASNCTDLATAIMDMYAKCGELGLAEKTFDEIVCKDVVSWNAMIAGYSQARKHKSLLQLLNQMLLQGFNPSRPTVLLSLQACTQLSALKMGMAIHGRTISNRFSQDVSIKGLLIDMYSKCGQLSFACGVFAEVNEGNVNAWSCMINGLGIHGHKQELLMLFFRMLKHGVEPDGVCFLILLSSCSHWGLVEKGWKIFYMLFQFGITPLMEHWATMVDLMGRGGCIGEALGFMKEMPLGPDSSMVGAFLGACRVHGDGAMGKEVGDWLIGRGCAVAGFYKLLVSIRAGEEEWNEVIMVRELIEQRKLRRNSGSSLIETSNVGLT